MHLSRIVGRVVPGLVAVVLAAPSHAAVVTGTVPPWNYDWVFSQMGEQPDTPGTEATWGQTFTLPAGASNLTQWSYWVSDSPIIYPDPVDFRAVLMAWTGTRATGPILYQSPVQTADGHAHGAFRRFDFSMNVPLDPGSQYVMFMTCSGLFDGVDSWMWLGGIGWDADPTGHLVVLNSQNDFSLVTMTDWSQNPLADMAYEAVFDGPIPEPSAVAALLPAAIATLTQRRRH